MKPLDLGSADGVRNFPVSHCPLHVVFWIVAHCYVEMSFSLMIGCWMCWMCFGLLLEVVMAAKDMVLGLGVDVVVELLLF